MFFRFFSHHFFLVAKNITTNEMHKRDDIIVNPRSPSPCLYAARFFVVHFPAQAQHIEQLNEWAKAEKCKGDTSTQVVLHPRHSFLPPHASFFGFKSDHPEAPDLANVWHRGVKQNLTEGNAGSAELL